MLDGIIRLLEWIFEKGETYVSPFCVIQEYEDGVLMRLGKYRKNLKKGWNWKIPFVDQIVTAITSINTFHIANVNITTIDNKTVSLGAVIEYEITDIKKHLIDMNEAESNAHDICRGLIADHLTDCEWEEIKDKKTLTKLRNKLKPELAEMGISIRQILIADIVQTRAYTLIKD